jgi:hypothetical protein
MSGAPKNLWGRFTGRDWRYSQLILKEPKWRFRSIIKSEIMKNVSQKPPREHNISLLFTSSFVCIA